MATYNKFQDFVQQLAEKTHNCSADQFNVYLITHRQEETLEAYCKDVIPEFSRVAA